jgi:uncharacterized protein (TIGR00255 family)
MIKSMTGYGDSVVDYDKFTVKTEIRSVNNKFMDINIRLPRFLHNKELQLRNELSKLVERGSVTVAVSLEFKKDAGLPQRFNKDMIISYAKELNDIREELNLDNGNMLQLILAMPDVQLNADRQMDDSEWANVKKGVLLAFQQFDQFRITEGAVLQKELALNTEIILRETENIEKEEPLRVASIREKLRNHLDTYIESDKIDQNRFEQEIVYYLEKIDIAEEKVRLRSHCSYFLESLKEKSAGKKLGFIAQEMGREINTIGSKANNLVIQKAVVIMKEELEKIKEQTLNIL